MRETSWRTRVELQLAELESSQSAPPDSYVAAIKGVENLYKAAIRTKRIWALSIRSFSAALATIGVLLPILSQLFNDNGKQAIPPFWSSVAFAAAGVLVSLDYYLKIWKSWKNCMVTESAIHRELDRFLLAQLIEELSSASIDRDAPEGVRTKSRISSLLAVVRSRVDSEKKESDWRNPRARTIDLLGYCRPFPR